MLMLLPPSEGKTAPDGDRRLDLASLSSPRLTATRERILATLIRTCSGNPKIAMTRLGLGPTQLADVERNARLLDEPVARADAVYTGVLYSAWDPATQSDAARHRADERVAIASALFGLLRPSDLIPAYRLSATADLPRLGTLASRWRPTLGPAIEALSTDGLLVDLRSGTYVNLHRPAGSLAARTLTVRVLTETDGVRKVVSHFNKATKGELVRAIVASGEVARSAAEFADLVTSLGWRAERAGQRLDIVI